MAPEGFSGRFWGGSDKVTGGVCSLAGDFLSLLWDVEWCLLLKDPYLLSWYGLLEIRVEDITKHWGQKWKARSLKRSPDLELLIA